MSEGPFEPEGGQDDEPPNLNLSLLVAIHLLSDVRDYLDTHHERNLRQRLHRYDPHDDLLLRIAAVLAVLRRARREVDR